MRVGSDTPICNTTRSGSKEVCQISNRALRFLLLDEWEGSWLLQKAPAHRLCPSSLVWVCPINELGWTIHIGEMRHRLPLKRRERWLEFLPLPQFSWDPPESRRNSSSSITEEFWRGGETVQLTFDCPGAS